MEDLKLEKRIFLRMYDRKMMQLSNKYDSIEERIKSLTKEKRDILIEMSNLRKELEYYEFYI